MTQEHALANPDELLHLQQIVDNLLTEAKQQGATAAEAGVSNDSGLSVTVRLGEVETVERTSDHSLGVTVYFDQRKGSANTTDLSPAAISDTVSAACRIAKYTSEDKYAGLPPPELMACDYPDLDLFHPWPISVEETIERARECEEAARSYDARIENSEGASVNSHAGQFIYGNSHGFVGGYPSSRHGLSCAVVASGKNDMQRDYWYTSARAPEELESAASVGEQAAARTIARLNGRQLGTRKTPVIFRAEIAPSLLRGLVAAVRGPALYRNASFLLDHLGKAVFPDWVRIHEDPLKRRGLASAPFDNEGVATRARDLVNAGILQSYVLDSYAARKLGMDTTGNAGGVRNLTIEPGPGESNDLAALMQDMGNGLLITEMMGQGASTVTGDYSRGAAGFWVENGEIQYPVEEITVAGNLRDMFQGLVAVGSDDQIPGSVRTGSWLIDSMTVAGT